MTLIANARMYTAEPTTDAAWRALLAWVAQAADVPMRYEPHAAPATLPALWQRDDLCCALMCGFPLATWHDVHVARPVPLAAAVPLDSEAPDDATYRTALVTPADSALASVEALRGCRFAYTTPDSQSGYQAVREWAAERAQSNGGRWFGALVGPLVTPRGVVDALLRGDADAGPLDAYWLALLQAHEPATAARLRVLAWTAWSPIPPFVCSAAVPALTRDRIGAALVAAGRAPALASLRATLRLATVVPADPGVYDRLAARARAVDDLGYPSLQ
jgi:ABC-type phosphate/phosphonate transport system substrate-binding protein